MKYIQVQFTSEQDKLAGKDYTYVNKPKVALKTGDVVIVPTQYGMTVAVVTAVSSKEPDSVCSRVYRTVNYKEVAEKITSKTITAQYVTPMLKDKIKKQLDEKIKKMDELTKYKAYASDPDVAALIAQLEKLSDYASSER